MELKVWVDGRQRVVCGVTEQTTCHDVIMALAAAMGKTGRFTLVEKWRDNERLLAPTEAPVQVLHKWGEYATDVQFLLRYSGSYLKGHQKSSQSWTGKILLNNTEGSQSLPSGHRRAGSLKKALTFSGAHSHSYFRPHNGHDKSSLESLEDRSSVTSQSSRSSLSPYASFEGQVTQVPTGQKLYMRSPFNSLDKRGTSDRAMNFRPRPPPPTSRSTRPSSVSSSGSLERPSHLRTPALSPPPSSTSSSSPAKSLPYSPPTSPTRTSPSPKILTLSLSSPPRIPSPVRTPTSDLDKSLEEDPQLDVNQNRRVPEKIYKEHQRMRKSSSSSTKSLSAEDDDKQKLMEVVSRQMEKLKVQQSRLKLLQSETGFWESRDEDHARKERTVSSELDTLTCRSTDQNNELEELELVSWVDKLEMERETEGSLRNKITSTHEEMEKRERELDQMRKKAEKLAEEIEAEKARQEQEAKEKEIKSLQEVSDLQKQINQQLVQHEENQTNIEKLQSEVKTLESDILDRKTQCANLEKDVTNTNLDVFTKTPSDWIRTSTEASLPFNRSSSARPFGVRKIPRSPLLLKETVATSRNPHGLWV